MATGVFGLTTDIFLERLKRAGRFAEVLSDDPFDPEGTVSVTLTEAEGQSLARASPPRDPSPGRSDFSRN